MSRALYHLSYGTAQAGRKPDALKKEILSCRLRPRLVLALLRTPLSQGHSFPLVHALSKKCGGARRGELRGCVQNTVGLPTLYSSRPPDTV
jgi:hypothetical protein